MLAAKARDSTDSRLLRVSTSACACFVSWSSKSPSSKEVTVSLCVQWQPKALTEVKAGEVAWYASPLPEGEELEFELEKMLAEEAAKSAPTAKL